MSQIIGKAYNPYAMASGGSGLASGFAMGRQLAKEKELGDAVKGYVDAESRGDKKAMNSYLGVMAGVAPAETMNWINQQKALEQKNLERSFNTTNEYKNAQYLMSIGYPQDKAIEIAYKQNQSPSQNINPFERKRIENAASKIDENIAKANDRIAMYDRGAQLLDNGVETGGIGGYIKKNWLPTSALSADTQEFQSLVSKLVPQQRPSGSGTTSDRDMAIYEKATIGLDKDTKTNKNILALGKAMAENDKAYEELRSEWASAGGSLSEFDKVWRKYANEQRIYNDDGTINQNRVSPYEWFSNGGSSQQEQPTREEIIAELKRRGEM